MEKLDYLIKTLNSEIEIPETEQEKKDLFRSLMNTWKVSELPSEFYEVQDEYLQEILNAKGITRLEDLTEIDENIYLWQGDITTLQVDAIVNAANSQMLGCFIPMHTCIDNCIHSYAGIQLREECNQQMQDLRKKFGPDYEQPTAVPMVTEAYNLPAKKVIRVVGPIVENGLNSTLEKQLMDCYWNVLEICKEYRLKTVAFCCISTGVFHFPNRRAAELAVRTVEKWLKCNPNIVERVIFNVFKNEDKAIYEQLLS